MSFKISLLQRQGLSFYHQKQKQHTHTQQSFSNVLYGYKDKYAWFDVDPGTIKHMTEFTNFILFLLVFFVFTHVYVAKQIVVYRNNQMNKTTTTYYSYTATSWIEKRDWISNNRTAPTLTHIFGISIDFHLCKMISLNEFRW